MASKKLLLALAVVLTAVGLRTWPEVVLRLPMGFIPYAMLGHRMPPFFNYDAYTPREFATWTRPGDVVVATAAKCGANWMLYVSHLIRTKGDLRAHPFPDVNVVTPWTSLIHAPGQTWQEVKALLNTTVLNDGSRLADHWNHQDYPFRIFHAHEVPRLGPENTTTMHSAVLPVLEFPQVKFVGMIRPLADMMASYYPFIANLNNNFRDMWGGFPPPYKSKDALLADYFPSAGGPLADSFFGYVQAWWNARGLKNVLLLHYNDAVKDLPDTVRRLAQFYEVDLTEELVQAIAYQASFASMKFNTATCFNYVLWGNPAFCNGTGTIIQDGKIFRSGKIGGGGLTFTVEEIARINAELQRELPDAAMRDWAQNGGPLPPVPTS